MAGGLRSTPVTGKLPPVDGAIHQKELAHPMWLPVDDLPTVGSGEWDLASEWDPASGIRRVGSGERVGSCE